MNLQIKTASPDDIPAIIELMREFAVYEDLLEYFEINAEKLTDAMFGPDAIVGGLIAFDGKLPIAYTLFFPYFASFRGQRGVYLEDIFVAEKYRKLGVGEKLLRQIARIANKEGAVRIDFQVLNWNKPAIDFYLKHDARTDESERHFRFTDEAFERLAA